MASSPADKPEERLTVQQVETLRLACQFTRHWPEHNGGPGEERLKDAFEAAYRLGRPTPGDPGCLESRP